MRSIRIYVYIILVFKLNINSFLYTYICRAFNSRRSEDVVFDKIKYSCCHLLK